MKSFFTRLLSAKLIKQISILFLFYFFLGAIIPYLFPSKINDQKKQEFNKTQYTSDKNIIGPDRVCIIESPKDAFNVRLEIIRNAEKTLDISSYKFKDDPCTEAFLGEILNAADRGVEIRIVFNSFINFAGKVKHEMKKLNNHPNIECKLYNQINLLYPWRTHAMLHDKIIIADDSMLLMGGRNFDKRHFDPNGYDKPITYDREVFVWKTSISNTNNISAIEQTKNYVNLLWNSKDSSFYKSKPDKNNDIYLYLKECANKYEIKNPQFYEKKIADYKKQTMETSRITLLHNPINTSKKEPWVAYQLLSLTQNAKQKVLLQTPYATANRELLRAFKRTTENSDLYIITNSMASTPNYPAFSNYRFQRQKFIKTGANIYELQSKNSNHAKSLVIDDRLSIVGSFNMDGRSMYIDTETMLVIDSPAAAKELTHCMTVFFEKALEVGEDNSYIETTKVEKLPVSFVKKMITTLTFVIMRPIQFLL